MFSKRPSILPVYGFHPPASSHPHLLGSPAQRAARDPSAGYWLKKNTRRNHWFVNLFVGLVSLQAGLVSLLVGLVCFLVGLMSLLAGLDSLLVGLISLLVGLVSLLVFPQNRVGLGY